jgi:hypothetical protein
MKAAKFIRGKDFNCSVYYKYKSKSALVAFFNEEKEFFRCEIRKATLAFIKKFGIREAEEILKNQMCYV